MKARGANSTVLDESGMIVGVSDSARCASIQHSGTTRRHAREIVMLGHEWSILGTSHDEPITELIEFTGLDFYGR